MLFDVFGNVHSGSMDAINLLATHHSRVSGYGFHQAKSFIYNKIICALNHGSVRMLLTRYSTASPFSELINWDAPSDCIF